MLPEVIRNSSAMRMTVHSVENKPIDLPKINNIKTIGTTKYRRNK